MTTESAFIELLRSIATDPAARGLNDDAAVIKIGTDTLIITHDMMVEGVHWLHDANPADVAWKLVATNLSDLAAKGARPVGVMLGYMLANDDWDAAFANGLGDALAHYEVPLLGGDTTKAIGNLDARCVAMTALGLATTAIIPARNGAQSGDALYVVGALGDAKAGYELARQGIAEPASLLSAFNRPTALVSAGQVLAPLVHAMMDVSDGLLIDAQRMAAASGLAINIDLSAIALSVEFVAQHGDTRESRIDAATWGDDYALLFAGPADAIWPVDAVAIGQFSHRLEQGSRSEQGLEQGPEQGLSLHHDGEAIALPDRLGFEHSC